MIGRDDLREQVVAAVLAGRPVVVPGGPGMGKTTLTLAAAHDSRLVARFGARRVFVPLDAATSGDAAARALAQALGAPSAGSLRDVLGAIAQRAAAAPVLALLDNAETPDQADPPGMRDTLAQLAAAPGLALLVSLRGAAVPLAGATVLKDLTPLGPDEARDLFLRGSTQIVPADPDLPTLLKELDYHPLSLVLLGRVAEGERRVAPVLADWRTRRAKILADGRGDHRLTSVRASLAVSLASPAMTGAGRRLVGLLALAPGGLRRADCADWIDADAPRLLLKLRLAAEREAEGGARLSMLAPLREAAKLDSPASEEDFGRYWAMIATALASSEARFRNKGGSHEAAIREADNLDAALAEANARGRDLDELGRAAQSLAMLVGFLGLGGFASLATIERRAEELAKPHVQAGVVLDRGDIALRRSDHAAARAAYEEARPIYARLGDALGEANCIQRLGDIALARSDHAAARAAYEEARPIYARLGSALGEANCIRSLGDIATKEGRPDEARELWEQALTLYGRIPEPHSIGWAHLRLVRLAPDAAARERHRQAARAAWLSIDRADLVAKHLDADGAG